MQQQPSKQSGLSIVEMLIVIALIGLIALLLTPDYETYFTQSRLKSAAEHLHEDILLAHSAAISESAAITLVFTTGASWCYGLTTSGSCTCTTAASCNRGQVDYSGFPNTTLSLSGFSGSSTQFDAARGIPSETGNITFTSSGGETITVKLKKLGVAQVCSSDVGGYPSC